MTDNALDPGALYLLSLFYTRKEIATRLSILYSGNIFATSFAGLIAAATFSSIDGAQGLKGWQWLFIIEGTFNRSKTNTNFGLTCCVIRYRDLRGGNGSNVSSSRLSAHHSLAHPRRAHPSIWANQARHCWHCTRQRSNGGIEASPPWSPSLSALLHAEHASFSVLFQQLLPHGDWFSRLQLHNHSRPDMPTIPSLRLRRLCRRSQLWQIQWKNLAYHNLHGRSNGWIHHLLRNAEHPCPLHILLPLHLGSLRRQLRDLRLGLCNSWTDDGEESRVTWSSQCHCKCFLHLYAIPVSIKRRTKILSCHGCELRVCLFNGGKCLGFQDLVDEIQQEDQEEQWWD